jgi:hypothetical protein
MMILLDRLKQSLRAPCLACCLMLASLWLMLANPAAGQQLIVKELWRTNGDPATILFVSVSGAAEASDGSIWISDGRAGQVLALDSTLAVRVVAREGDGPGEVRSPTEPPRVFRRARQLSAGTGS